MGEDEKEMSVSPLAAPSPLAAGPLALYPGAHSPAVLQVAAAHGWPDMQKRYQEAELANSQYVSCVACSVYQNVQRSERTEALLWRYINPYYHYMSLSRRSFGPPTIQTSWSYVKVGGPNLLAVKINCSEVDWYFP